MIDKIKKLGRIAGLTLAVGTLGLGLKYLIIDVPVERMKRESAEISAAYNMVSKINESLGSGIRCQELLDNLNVDYNLKENERVYLIPGMEAMVVVESTPNSGMGTMRGSADRVALENYLSQEKK